ncbi:uncharacterized protein UV8b_03489 [Ustilaginoidea virens]|uniref:Uncharacterized protein n=1 Tax=Ustilaginoidea virens TaxID=1159556 RepID=A0A8E5MG77_USTVR|nr:uncharacterized protein UV8b_03489 [Ustilaginoidea virens]QUC19248.1 hypothetical protein UV8b_03489 [Ustilaginoidea virens]
MDAELREKAESLALRASRACGIPLRRDDVQAALGDPDRGPPFAEWIRLHLRSDTLLTPDELETYVELDKRGRVDELAGSHDLAQVRAVTEDELRVATEELGRSTEHIARQTETLRQQHDAVSRMAKKQAETAAQREELERVQRRQNEQERHQLTMEVENLSREIHLSLAEMQDQGPALAHGVAAVLQSDDKLLSSLQKLGCELDQPDPDEALATEKLRAASMRLINTTVEAVRARLDMVYLEALVAAEHSNTVAPATSQQVAHLQEEVESLYSEIFPVAQMAAEKQHVEPALEHIAARSGQSLSKTASSLKYVDDCLTYLLDRMARLRAHVESHKSYQAASASIASVARAEMAVEVPFPGGQTAMPPSSTSQSPVKKRSNAADARAPRQSLGAEARPPLETLLERLAISLPEEAGERDRIAALERTLADRTRKYDQVARAAQESFETTTRAYLDDARKANQFLRDSLLAESPFGDVKMVDPDVEASIRVLEQEVDKAKEKLRYLQGQAVLAGSQKKAEFINRWGS